MIATHDAAGSGAAATTAASEVAVQLGPEGNLVGVLAGPAAAGAASTRPAIVILNAGVIHRVGPHRLHVRLARRLAADGVSSLRLDLSGIGDSAALTGELAFRDRAVADARLAMDELAARAGATRFVLFGLCSGADNALATALADDRIVGLVVLDPPAYVTRRARARQVLARARELGGKRATLRWGAAAAARRVRAQLDALTRRRELDAADAPEPERSGGRELPPPAAYRAMLATLADRGVRVLAIHTGALGPRYNHADQLFELFPELRGRLDAAYFPDANHMFTERAAQARLIAAAAAWLGRTFP